MRAVRLAGMVIALVSIVSTGGCDFFKSSGPEGGVSPFISDLRVSRASVTCGRDFILTFSYRDPQDDIETMRVSFQHESGFFFDLEVLWETNGGVVLPEGEEPEEDIFGGTLDLRNPGRASYAYHFQCDIDRPTGNYAVTVQLVDARDHTSNSLSQSINLISN